MKQALPLHLASTDGFSNFPSIIQEVATDSCGGSMSYKTSSSYLETYKDLADTVPDMLLPPAAAMTAPQFPVTGTSEAKLPSQDFPEYTYPSVYSDYGSFAIPQTPTLAPTVSSWDTEAAVVPQFFPSTTTTNTHTAFGDFATVPETTEFTVPSLYDDETVYSDNDDEMDCDDAVPLRHQLSSDSYSSTGQTDALFSLRADKGHDCAPVPSVIHKYDNQKFAEGPAWHTSMTIVLRVAHPELPDGCSVHVARTMKDSGKQDISKRPLPCVGRGDGWIEFELKNSYFGFGHAGWVRRQLDQVTFNFLLMSSADEEVLANSETFSVEKIRPAARWED